MALPHVSHGQPLARSATRENAYTDAANDFLRRRDSAIIGGKADRKIWDAGAVWVKNVSASNYDRYSVVGLRDPIFADPAQAAFGQFTGFEVSSPSDPSAPFAILQEPLRIGVANRIGVTEGITPARVLINDADHGYASPVSGETGYLESSETGPAEILWKEASGETRWALVRIGPSAPDGFSDIVRAVTNVCPIGETSGVLYVATDDYEISTSGGQAIVAGSFDADAGKVTIRGVVDWTDPDFAAGSGDSFGFYLKVNGENYTGAPVHLVTFVGTGASMQKEMVWELALTQAGTIDLALWAYRVAGSRSLTAASSSRIEVNGNVAGIKVEYRQIIVPPGSHIGPKVCVVNPTDCCLDDDSSTADTASRISVSCCSVPIPAMRMVDLSSAAIYSLPGWQPVGFGWGEVNFDETFTEIKDQLKKVHYLPYVGEFTDTRVRCVYEKEIPLDNLWASSRTGFSEAVRSQLLNHYIEIRFIIAERQPGEQSPFNDLNIVNGQLVGPAPAAEYRAHCSLGIAVKVYSSANPSPQFGGGFGFFQPHTTNEFYASQPDGTYLWEKANTLPTAGTSCIGNCNLLMFGGTPTGGWPTGLEPHAISAISLSPTLSVVPIG